MLKKLQPSYSQSISFQLNPIVSTTTTTANKNVITETYHNPKLEEKIASIQSESHVDLSYWHLIDQDMLIIVKEIITDKQCTDLCLCGNKIRSQGASIIALSLSNNSTLKCLDLSFNHISDVGVCTLTQNILLNKFSSLKILFLNKNGISNEGAHYLSEMLETNQTLTELWLTNNEIGNEGVKKLSNVLINHNKTLELLSLEFNIFITDFSIDYLLQILEHNQTLKNISINNCNLSEIGKTKLREKIDRMTNFQIKVISM